MKCLRLQYHETETYEEHHFLPVLRPFHTERKKAKWISDAMTCWNKTTASYGCFHIGREHSHRKCKCFFFFRPVPRIFSVSQSENTARPIRFELGSRDRSSCCCAKGWEWWRCFENQCNQTPKKSLSDKRVDAEFLLSLVFENRFIHTEYILIILLLNHVICRAPSSFYPRARVLWVGARSLSRSSILK